MTKSKTWRFDHFVGIDVSKNQLDITVMHRRTFLQHYQIINAPTAIMAFVKLIKNEHQVNIPTTVFGMEQTGIYINHLVDCLSRLRANILVQDAKHIKNSLGTIRGKNDKIDSKRIASYLVKNRDELSLRNARRAVILELARLTSLRERLVGIQVALKIPLKEEKDFIHHSAAAVNQKLTNDTMNSLASDIQQIENYVETIWKNDENIKRLMDIITSVPGVGHITALQIVITTNEFLNISDHKKFACYCGIAPFEHSSGTSVRLKSRVSNQSNKRLKSLLHICALSAKRFDPEISAYYLRKTQDQGKAKMSVINAIRFKILARIFTCVKDNRLFQKEKFQSKITIRNYETAASHSVQ